MRPPHTHTPPLNTYNPLEAYGFQFGGVVAAMQQVFEAFAIAPS